MMQKIADNIWKMSLDCNLYFLDWEKSIPRCSQRGQVSFFASPTSLNAFLPPTQEVLRTSVQKQELLATSAIDGEVVDFRERIVIDTGKRGNRHLIEQFLGKLIDLTTIKKVIFTHLHYDHIGNFDLFSNAEFYASQKEIDDFKSNPDGTVLNEDILQKFRDSGIELKPVESIKEELKNLGLEIIETPGHTAGSICIWYPEEKILFSGDTLLKKSVGRTDLPTSDRKAMQRTINGLSEIGYKILATGHDY